MTTTKQQKRTTVLLGVGALSILLAGAFAWANDWRANDRSAPPKDPNHVVKPPPPKKKAARPQVEVVFVIDTTGSMGSLLEGAKKKVWSIANRIASGQPRPEVRFGLVGYRDLGDDYVTKLTPMTKDLDDIQEALLGFEANGGGDGPEHVNQALADALRRMQWSPGKKVLKLIFLVGDAPPHDDYADGLSSVALAKEAKQAGIIINTIRCGSDGATESAWRAIASLSSGRFASISQGGGVVALATPFDDDLSGLNATLADSTLAWGKADRKASTRGKVARRKSMSAPAAADVASFSAKSGRLDSGDLITAMMEGSVALDELPHEELPETLKAMPKSKRKAYVKKAKKARDEIRTRILKVSAKREAWLDAEEAKRGLGGRGATSFDGNVVEMLEEQAADYGIAY